MERGQRSNKKSALYLLETEEKQCYHHTTKHTHITVPQAETLRYTYTEEKKGYQNGRKHCYNKNYWDLHWLLSVLSVVLSCQKIVEDVFLQDLWEHVDFSQIMWDNNRSGGVTI